MDQTLVMDHQETKPKRRLKLKKKTLSDYASTEMWKAAGGGRGTDASGASICCCCPPTP